MAADVKLRFESQVGNSTQVLTALEKKVEKLGNRLEATSRKGRRGATGMTASFSKMLPGLLGIAGGFSVIQRAIGAVLKTNKEFSASVSEIATKQAELELKLQIQAGLTPAELQKKIPVILKNLLQTPSTDLAGALSIETQLASSGFKKIDIDSGSALQTMLKLKAATNQFGRSLEDPKESVKAISQFIKGSQGIAQPTAKDIEKVGGGLTQLFEGSEIQFRDLTDLAAKAAKLSASGLTPEMQVAAFSVIRDVKESPEAATGLRQVVSRLESAGLSKVKVDALKSIGLTPQDIDLVGKDFPAALGNLNTALSKVDERKQRAVRQILFGEKGAEAGEIILSRAGQIPGRVEAQKGPAFLRNVKTFQESTFAREQRLGVREETAKRIGALSQGDITFEFLRKAGRARQAELMLTAKNQRERNKINAQAALSEKILDVQESLGKSPLDTPQFETIRRSRLSLPEQVRRADKSAVELAIRKIEELQAAGGLPPVLRGREGPPLFPGVRQPERPGRNPDRQPVAPVIQPADSDPGKLLGEVKAALVEGNMQRAEQTTTIKNSRVINRNANR